MEVYADEQLYLVKVRLGGICVFGLLCVHFSVK